MENIQLLKKEHRLLKRRVKQLESLNTELRRRNAGLRIELSKAQSEHYGLRNNTSFANNAEDLIFEAVKSEYTYFEKWMISIRSRRTDIVMVRQIFQTLLYEKTSASLNNVGDITGGRDHSTIKNAIRVVSNMCDTDREYKRKYDRIIAFYESNKDNSESFKTGDRIGDAIS